MWWRTGLMLGATLLLSACAPAGGGPSPATVGPVASPPSPTAATAPASAVPSLSPGPGPGGNPGAAEQQAVQAARQAAKDELGLDPASLQVDQVEARQWPDASLGCPRQGVMYAQIVTPGYLVVLSGGGKQLEYHTDSRGRVVLCAQR